MAGALDGIRIIDMSNVVSGPMAVQMLADQGADVIKIEAPGGGDIARPWGEVRGGVGAMFAIMNRNKRSIVLNMQEDDGRNILLDLVAGADVLVQNFRPGAMDRMGLGYDTVKKRKKDLVYVSISGYGEDGPYAKRRAYDAMIQTATGYAAIQAGSNQGVPDLIKNIVCDKVTALTAAQAITAALLARERGAGGQEVKISMMEAGLAFIWPDGMFNNTMVGEGGTPMPPLLSLVRPSRTADGYVTCAAVSDVEWRALTKALGKPEMGTHPKYAGMMDRFSNWDEIMTWIDEELAPRKTDEVCALLDQGDVPFAKLNTPDNLHDDPQIRHSQSLVEMEHEHAGIMRMARPPARFQQTPSDIRYLSPMLGEHTDEILAELGCAPDVVAAYRVAGVVE